MTPPAWIRRETLVALHEQLLALLGGAPGVRDENALRSVLSHPAASGGAGSPSVFALAAGYCSRLLNTRPFVEGNLAVGFTSAVLFLELNGYRLRASDADAVIHTLAFAAQAMDDADYAAWLQSNAQPVDAPATAAGISR